MDRCRGRPRLVLDDSRQLAERAGSDVLLEGYGLPPQYVAGGLCLIERSRAAHRKRFGCRVGDGSAVQRRHNVSVSDLYLHELADGRYRSAMRDVYLIAA